MSSDRASRLLRAALPVLALTVFGVAQAAVLASAGATLGYDFLAYHAAARRVLDGLPLYELTGAWSGDFGSFLYPPAFLAFVLPFGPLDAGVAAWAWTGLLLAALVAGIWLLPVRTSTRWLVLLLAGLSWPVAYTIKLGQVTPLLLLLAVVGWRALGASRASGASAGVEPGRSATWGRGARGRREVVLGASAAMGAAIKVQPVLLLVWAALTRRWAAVAWGAVVLVVLGAVSLLLSGPGAWFDYVALLRQAPESASAEHNVAAWTVATGLGLPAPTAAALQAVVSVGALVAMVVAAWRADPVASYLVAITASQVVSPVLRDHYAMLLLLPVAWLVEARQRWAVLIPLVTSLPLVSLTPPAAYSLVFGLAIVATLAVGIQGRLRAAPIPTPLPAG